MAWSRWAAAKRGPRPGSLRTASVRSPLILPAEATKSGLDGSINGAAIVDGRAYLVGQIRGEGGAADDARGAVWSGPAALLEP